MYHKKYLKYKMKYIDFVKNNDHIGGGDASSINDEVIMNKGDMDEYFKKPNTPVSIDEKKQCITMNRNVKTIKTLGMSVGHQYRTLEIPSSVEFIEQKAFHGSIYNFIKFDIESKMKSIPYLAFTYIS